MWNYTEPFYFIPFMIGFGGWVMDDRGTPTLDNDGVVNGLIFIKDLRGTHKIVPAEADYNIADALFKDGKAAMIINDTIPTSLEEAARIDGCNQFGAFYRVILPLAAPALLITGLFSFMTAWAEYLVAAQILQDSELWTIPLGLKSFEANMSTEWGLYGAASMIIMVPVVVLFLILSRSLVSGLTLGSVKG